MSDVDEPLDIEEQYLSTGQRKLGRKERHLFRTKDRSKFRKSDEDQRAKRGSASSHSSEKCVRGRVLAIHADLISVDAGEGMPPFSCTLKGTLKVEQTKMRTLVAVGDRVRFERGEGGSGQIIHIEPRHSYLARSDPFSGRKRQLIAVNIDRVFIVLSLFAPPFKPLLIDRYIIAAKRGNMEPLIVINKIDLLDSPPPDYTPSEADKERELLVAFEEGYRNVGVPVIRVSADTRRGIGTLRKMMAGKASVFSGESGVGKSSLIGIVTGRSLRVARVLSKTRRGAHTTNRATLIPLERGRGEERGFCIDTPGIRSFGIHDIDPKEVARYFPDFAPYEGGCGFPDCTHLHEPGCAVKRGVEEGCIHPLRYRSYCALMEERRVKDWE
ncbi:MAG: ribosome small subunit-dependent GTPase A [Simkaniaceae bacterium]|nr:ribosome small subunit-dependent GTPase A [Simkaniaceae bacterium]